MATFQLNSIIKISGYKPFKGCNEITIKKSLRNYGDTALVKLPATAVMKQGEKAQTKSVLTAQQFKRGDRINIQLGYNGLMREEFNGFISRINKTTPVEIECEGFAFQLRDKTLNKSWRTTTLKEVLQTLIADTDIVLGDVADLPLDNYKFIKTPGYKALELIKKDCGGAVGFWFEKNVLHADLIYTRYSAKNKDNKPDAIYRVGVNIIRDGQMKERLAGDAANEVEFYFNEPGGKRKKVNVGVVNSNAQRKKLQAIRDTGKLKELATEVEQNKNYTGVEGKVTGFLQPFFQPGAKLQYEDPKYPELNANVLVESIEVKYGVGGARRTAEIGIKL